MSDDPGIIEPKQKDRDLVVDKDYSLMPLERLVEENKALRRLLMIRDMFICGDAGANGQDGLPEFLMVCPARGLDGFAVYKKFKDYSAPEW